MELDLELFLRSRGGDLSSDSSEEGEPTATHRRTVDEILNDTDSDSSPAPGALPSISHALHKEIVTIREEELRDGDDADHPSSSFVETLEEPYKWRRAGEVSSFSYLSSLGYASYSNASRSSSSARQFPSLFTGVRPKPRPGAALAAAAAASRSIPTPHAAAIKSKRSSGGSIQKVLLLEDSTGGLDVDASFVSEDLDERDFSLVASSSGRLGGDEDVGVVDSSLTIGSSALSGFDVAADELLQGDVVSTEKERSFFVSDGETSENVKEDLSHSLLQFESKEILEDLPSPRSTPAHTHVNVLEMNDDLLSVKKADANDEHDLTTNEASREIISSEAESFNNSDGKNSSIGEESGTSSEIDSLVGQLANEVEGTQNAEKKSSTPMKPLDWAEELEKRKASSGLHWEEGAAAQPMRLEGIRRGPPAVGYLQMDLDNMITRAFSSQTFKHDYGLPHVLAVHMNFIAVGTSKGVVLVFPCKYSPHYADNMDGKMLTFGSSGEKIPVPVTSMCFNQQGDLLLVGYFDGHLTIWDVQRGTSAKVITGEHNAPVTHTLFLEQDSQVSRQFKAVTGDSKGLVLLHTSSVFILHHFSIKTQCLLDGQKNSTVLCACPVVMDNSQDVGSTSSQVYSSVPSSGLGAKVGGVVGADTGWKLFNGNPSIVEEGVVVLATNQNALVVRLSPTVQVYENLSKPDGVREGSMPYAAWKCMGHSHDSSLDKVAWLAIAWDKKIQIFRLAKSKIRRHNEWTLDSTAIGVAWLDDQMLVILSIRGQLCLFSRDGAELHQTNLTVDCSSMDDFIIYHTHYMNTFGNPEKAYHNSVAVRGATIYILGPMHLIISRLLPWKERIQVLQKAGDWMGALDMAMRLYDGHAHGVIDLPRTVTAIREAIMPYLVELISSYVDEVFSYISIAFYNQIDKIGLKEDPSITDSSVRFEIAEQYARVGGVAVEFCVHIKKTDLLFDGIFSKFVAVQHEGTFLEILEPYILRDMLGCLPPEIMQALVEHYSIKGWLERVEQCVLHMDISSLDFNQVVRLCREHGLYGALIYLFNKGLNDFKAPLEELLLGLHSSSSIDVASIGYRMLVYLKYCFQGLAFPPGHGYLPPSRSPSIWKELLEFLLEDSKISLSQVSKKLKSFSGNLPNLFYILYLDTEAALDVLQCAFNEAEHIKDPSDLGQPASHVDLENKHELEYSKSQYSMVQSIANALISIIDLESDIVWFFEMDCNEDVWPLKKDIYFILDFIAYLVASKRATISARVLMHIAEYLTLHDHSQKDRDSIKERRLLSVLKAVPQEIWDTSFVLPLCMEAKFYQACGFIHYIRGEYVDALDSYMQDLDEPIHAFSFINKLFLQLDNTKALLFQAAVISRFPELVKLSRECTFFLAIDQLDIEMQNILSQLHSHPQSLFLFLKTLFDFHISGTLNFPVPETALVANYPNVRMRDSLIDIADYLEKLSNFPKLLHHDTIQVTDEMAELYLELLCQFERNSVLKFLETFDNYRLEHCLRLCQEYGVTDAAAFLLERVGDVGSALVVLMSGLDEKIELLVFAVVNKFSDATSRNMSETEQLADALKLTEAYAVHDVLRASVGLCQRNTQRLDQQESESLWFRLFDSFMQVL
ncbi:vacuolar protein sorting-associated protein 8 homolog isoform X2 [Phalaenopsis equestris]|uniref:vacuolar protein sorting-associated protein 8 homolog isoform X2 n=1 Tax=Phalaenopsis equestris TaxID=78828 RepID=UPI0009E28F98|nr:vacuolar protein sorting-associated protein 8 homolog isoform X2 [Phalaenopsis equestris]